MRTYIYGDTPKSEIRYMRQIFVRTKNKEHLKSHMEHNIDEHDTDTERDTGNHLEE